MIARHQSNRRLSTPERLAQFPQAKGGIGPRGAKDAYETNSVRNQTHHPDWVLIAAVIFVVLVWGALFFCMYFIWAKYRGASTF